MSDIIELLVGDMRLISDNSINNEPISNEPISNDSIVDESIIDESISRMFIVDIKNITYNDRYNKYDRITQYPILYPENIAID